MSELDKLIKKVEDLFPKSEKAYLTCYNFSLSCFPYGWVFRVVNSWDKWSDNNYKHVFGIYNRPEYALQAFLDYIENHKINPIDLCDLSGQPKSE